MNKLNGSRLSPQFSPRFPCTSCGKPVPTYRRFRAPFVVTPCSQTFHSLLVRFASLAAHFPVGLPVYFFLPGLREIKDFTSSPIRFAAARTRSALRRLLEVSVFERGIFLVPFPIRCASYHRLYDGLRHRQRRRGHLQSRDGRYRARSANHGHHPSGDAVLDRRRRATP